VSDQAYLIFQWDEHFESGGSMKRILVLTALVFFLAGFLPFAAIAQTPALRVGYIDLQKVVIDSDKGKDAKKSLGDEFEKLRKNLTQKQDELQKLKDSLEKQASTMTPEARMDKEKQYQAKLKDFQRLQSDYEADMRQKEQELFQKIMKELEEVVKGFGESEKYTLILEKMQSGILYGSASIDLTDKVISLYNDSVKKKTPTKK
jgi:outer membrane protein